VDMDFIVLQVADVQLQLINPLAQTMTRAVSIRPIQHANVELEVQDTAISKIPWTLLHLNVKFNSRILSTVATQPTALD